MKNYGLLAVAMLVLTGCAAQPASPAAPQPLMGTTSTATAEPAGEGTPDPAESALAPDEASFLELVHRDWQGEPLPSDAALIAAGYDRCAATAQERVEHQDDFWPEWSGSNNMMLGFAAEYFLCPIVE